MDPRVHADIQPLLEERLSGRGAPLAVVDLFSGAGGMSWGFYSWGPKLFQLVGAVDSEASEDKGCCNATYEANLGLRPLRQDIATLDPVAYRQSLGLKRGALGVLISCAPCTGFSRKRPDNRRQDDPRNRLVGRTALFIEAFLPEFFVMENVPEMLLGRHRHHFEELRLTLEALGYSYRASVLDFAVLGLPQVRKRILVLAWREGKPIPPLPRLALRPRTVAEAIGHLPPLRAGEAHPIDPDHRCPGHSPDVLERIAAIPKDGGSWTDLVPTRPDLLLPSMRSKLERGTMSFCDTYGRMAWKRPAPTIVRRCDHPGNGRYLHPEQDRLLSVREMALLQGFPPEYRFLGTLRQRYAQVGDAVPPLVSRLVALHLLLLKAGLTWWDVLGGRAYPRRLVHEEVFVPGKGQPALLQEVG